MKHEPEINDCKLLADYAGDDLKKWKAIVGQEVSYRKYGRGMVTRVYKTQYGNLRIAIDFEKVGEKIWDPLEGYEKDFTDCTLPKELRNMRSKRAFLSRTRKALESDFLSADEKFFHDPDRYLISDEEYCKLKVEFVQDWASREIKIELDPEQAAAVAATEGGILVTARAGSGKTRTLVTRAIFLQKHCRVSPRALLLLAFNRKAADEMRKRLATAVGDGLPHVMDFHQLAYALVHPGEDLVYDRSSADQFNLSREVQEVIDEHLRSKEWRGHIRDLMLAHFREDWEHIVQGGFHLAMEELLNYRRSLPRETLRGEYVKSFGEKVIANALFENGVEYKYERNFRWNDINYRPDFTILTAPRGGVVIEYFGLEGDRDYDEMSQQKREFWTQRDEWAFLEFSPGDLAKRGVEGFVQLLLQRLKKAGIACRRRSEEEIWELVRRRAVDCFTKAMKEFIGRCRKRNLIPDDLERMVAGHSPCSTAEKLFLDVGISVYRGYLHRLAANNKEDYDGLMWRAVELIRNGRTRFKRDKGKEQGDLAKLRFVMIDEFQDFSQMFFDLVDAIRSVNPTVRFFCVGDDWQAINAFAGSELRFFKEFDQYFRDTSRCYIRTNYRSAKSVVKLGNAVMFTHGWMEAKPGRSDPGWVRVCKLDEFKPSPLEEERHKGDEITPAVLRLVRYFLGCSQDVNVVMLCRRHRVPWYVNYGEAASRASDELERFAEHIRSYLPEEDRGLVSASTTHKYKGLEASAVIVLDAADRSYPLIHPNWIFLRIFGDSIQSIVDEEWRLFYVAVTRAKDSLALITERTRESPCLNHARLTSLSWDKLRAVPSVGDPSFQLRVFGAYAVRD